MNDLMRVLRIYLLLAPFFIPLHAMEEKLAISSGAARAMRRLGGVISHIKPAMDKDAEQFTGEGFVSGTLVHTPQGPKPIQELVIGDEVCSFDRFKKERTVSKLVRRCQKKSPNVIKVQVDDEILESGDGQRLLDERMNWQYLRDIPEGLHVSSYDGDVQRIMHITRSPEERILHKLSLRGAHNYVVGDKKLVAHNDAIVLPAWLLWTFAGARVANACTSMYGIYSRRSAPPIENPFETMLQQRMAAYAMRNVTIADLQAANGAHTVSKELLEEYEKLIGLNTPIGSMAGKDLSRFADRMNMGAGIKNLLLMPQGPDLNEEQIKQAVKIGGGAAAVLGGAGAVGVIVTGPAEEAVSSSSSSGASASSVSFGESMTQSVKSSAINGTINATVQLGVGLWTRDINSIGQAANTFGWTVGSEVVKSGLWKASEVGGTKIVEKVAPKAAQYLPVVGDAITVVDGCWNIDSVGKTAKNWIKGKWSPAPAPVPAITIEEPIRQEECIRRPITDQLSDGMRGMLQRQEQKRLVKAADKANAVALELGQDAAAALVLLKGKKPKGKSAIPQYDPKKPKGPISGGGGGNNGGGGKGPDAGDIGRIATGAKIAKDLNDKKEQIVEAVEEVGAYAQKVGERVVNTLTKAEFMNLDWVRGNLRHVQGQVYEIINPLRGLTDKAARYLRFDFTHKNIEIMRTPQGGKGDMGSYNATVNGLVKCTAAVKDRIIGKF